MHQQHQETPTTTTKTMNPVLISGAGLSSLLLARALRAANIPIRIYERDASVSFRGQGYRLRLSDEGLDAIESVLKSPGSQPDAWDEFWAACGQTGGAGFATIDALTGEQVKQSTSESLHSRDGKIIGIARGDMRRIFMRGLEDDIEWNRHVTGYELNNNNNDNTATAVHALFADGTRSPPGSMLIGGEGIHSLVAKQLSGGRLKVYDSGARGIHGQAPTGAFKGLGEGVFRIVETAAQPPSSSSDAAAAAGNGTATATATTTAATATTTAAAATTATATTTAATATTTNRLSIITNVRSRDMHDPSLSFGWTMIAPPGVITTPDSSSSPASSTDRNNVSSSSTIGHPAARLAKQLTQNWHPRVRSLIDEMDDSEAAFWKITCSNAAQFRGVPVWPNDPRVTVIGDAVHSMTPAGGLGANTAVRDAALLGKLIADRGGFAEGITEAYEKEMRVYGSAMVAKSYALARAQFGIDIREDSPTI
ncbi:hypothetical protein BD289DRAFT_409866 [Coniella lustricola]|uniref:FAD-binding domain-containing protein n=1 Tax=Coniella lustricola TaxID=2025994 RepID=A0A2T3A7A2_9PEZI|nr:hypothetical protein BD289DRAFT_409866 [Coniella lustricola]